MLENIVEEEQRLLALDRHSQLLNVNLDVIVLLIDQPVESHWHRKPLKDFVLQLACEELPVELRVMRRNDKDFLPVEVP